jgi:chromosome partitioning protein
MENIKKDTRIISIFNQKGGVGKTTLALNVASYLVEDLKKTVLVIDNDGQGSSTYVLTHKDDDQVEADGMLTTCELMLEDDITICDCIYNSGFRGLDIIPATIDHTETDSKIINKMDSTRILSAKLKEIEGKYDFIIIDCSPNVLQSTQNALFASDVVLSPVEPNLFSKKGLRNLIRLIAKINRIRNIPLMHYAFLSKVDNSRIRTNANAAQSLEDAFDDSFIKDKISYLALYVKCFDDFQTVVTSHRHGKRGHKEIKALTTTLLEKINESEGK